MNDNFSEILPFLIELRKRLLKSVLVFSIIFLILVFFSNTLYTYLALPLLHRLPYGSSLIATHVAAPFFVPFTLSFYAALFLSVPFFIYQVWQFIAPGLYLEEKKWMRTALWLSTILFYVGTAFAYFVIFPVLFKFFTHSVPAGVLISPDISQYLDFTLKLFFIFGILFEIPVLMVLLVCSKLMTAAQFSKMRPYAIVGAFIVAMLLAPPDIFSQTLIALPLWMLFEIGIIACRYLQRRHSRSSITIT